MLKVLLYRLTDAISIGTGDCIAVFSSRLKELNETHRKVEHEIKIAVFTLINEINKKGKSLLQQLEVREL